jgi:DNA-binding MarR family transcriptional regulator
MPFPGFKRLAKRMGMTPTGVRAHARNLQKKGFLRRVKRPGKANLFDLDPLFEKLEALLPEVKERELTIGDGAPVKGIVSAMKDIAF